jgi:hypothetical protein
MHGTAFGEPSGLADTVESMSSILVDKGFSYCGKDYLTSGITGGWVCKCFGAVSLHGLCAGCPSPWP